MDDLVRYRMRILGVVAISLFLALVARLWFLQVLTSDEAVVIAETNITRVVTIQAPRGRILDNQGRVLLGTASRPVSPSTAGLSKRPTWTSRNGGPC